MTREDFAYRGVEKEWKILEFAPYFSPLYPRKGGFMTEIIDVVGKDELVERAKKDPLITSWERIEDVDYIATSDYASAIGKTGYYDLIAASHVIEHTTDIISFLNDCSKLLKDDGIVRLFIPDKRYDFDCFRECVSTRVAIDTYIERGGTKVHSIGTVVESNMRNVRESDGLSSYIPNSAFSYLKNNLILKNSNTDSKFKTITDYIKLYDENKYVNVHSWVVTPKSFETLIYELNILGFIDLQIDSIYTAPRCIEFFVDLKKGKIEKDDPNKRLQLYIERKEEDIEEYEDYLELQELQKLLKQGKHDLYIYGTGAGVKKIFKILDFLNTEYRGHIVSCGKRKEKLCNNHPVLEISEVEAQENVIILIGVENIKYREEIIPELKKRGFKFFF